jgi:soluble lytic murein transglycosylase-like protein
MSNDDHTLGSVLLLFAGGATGYAAGRWLVEPWLASRSIRPSAKPVATAMRRSLAAGPIDPYGGPSGEMKPIDPYAGPSGEMKPIDPYADDPASVVAAPIVITPTTSPNQQGATTASPQPDGPITSPAQVDPSLVAPARTNSPGTSPAQLTVAPSATPGPSKPPTKPATPPPSSSGKFATSAGVRRFDPVFERYRGTLPLAYVRALVERESDGRPDVRTGRGAVGLMQIVPVVLADYNKRHGITYQTADLVDPSTNVAIGCELLRLIVESYRKNHPHVPNLQTDWNNPRFLELLTFGWNAGFSEAGGVGRVARYLEQLGGANDITLDLVTAYAELAGASKHLSNPAKVAWCKSVVVLCQRERALVGARPALATS